MDELEIIQHTQIPGITLFFDTVDYRTPHVHPELEFLLVLDEPLLIGSGLQRFRAEPGTLVVFHPNQPHEFYKEQNCCTFLCVQVAEELFEHIFPAASNMAFTESLPFSLLTEDEQNMVCRDLMDIARSYLKQEEGYELYVTGKVALFLHFLMGKVPHHTMTREESRNQDRRNDRLTRLIDYVNQNYMHKIRLTDFAKSEQLSLNYMSSFIKETMNQSFQEYVNSVRFNAACKQISSGTDNLIDVCIDCGFSDYRYFSRTFRERLGMTPAEYQQQHPVSKETAPLRRSLRSLEQFYSREQSLALCDKLDRF